MCTDVVNATRTQTQSQNQKPSIPITGCKHLIKCVACSSRMEEGSVVSFQWVEVILVVIG